MTSGGRGETVIDSTLELTAQPELRFPRVLFNSGALSNTPASVL